ncbi:hypothetical protein NKH60_33755 [Mesorhizobium sp. M1006]|uniref:hypothetical protein n=1 Tax=Mesorhizobium sp. M1006 TaxID=2957048 RepID=UPI00333D6AE9
MVARFSTREFLEQKGPIVVFGFFTFIGCAFICFSKYLGLSPFIVTGVPIALMVAYWIVNMAAKILHIHDEQAGDNLYYIGFLFTLTSLGASLFQFNTVDSIDAIVRNFGVAVASTIFGILLRILYNQMRRDPIDIERTTRHEMADMVRKLRTEMDTAALEFASYRRASNQMLQEGFDEIAKQAEMTGQKILKIMENLSQESVRPIQLASNGLQEVLEKHSKLFDDQFASNTQRVGLSSENITKLHTTLEQSIKKFAESIELTGKKLEAMKTPEEVLKIELGSVLTGVGKITSEHTKRMDAAAEEQRSQFQQIRETFGPVQQILSGLERSADSTESLIRVMLIHNNNYQHLVQNLAGHRPPPLPIETVRINGSVHSTSATAGLPEHAEVLVGSEEVALKPAEPKRGWFT